MLYALNLRSDLCQLFLYKLENPNIQNFVLTDD